MKNKKRSDTHCAKISLLTVSGIEYENAGYASDLYYYQGKESINKAERLAEKMPKEKGQELIDFIRESNKEMEELND